MIESSIGGQTEILKTYCLLVLVFKVLYSLNIN